MKKRKKIIILSLISLLVLIAGITYSVLSSSANIVISDQEIAKFIFNAEPSNNIELILDEMNPGDTQDILFSVSNVKDEEISEVSIEYEIYINTYHFIPFTIKLYKMNEEEEFIYECLESENARNEKNELVCKVPVQFLNHQNEQTENYKLKVEFPSEFDDISYSGLIDYINLEIKSWQKTS